jgi:hypothetical protein
MVTIDETISYYCILAAIQEGARRAPLLIDSLLGGATQVIADDDHSRAMTDVVRIHAIAWVPTNLKCALAQECCPSAAQGLVSARFAVGPTRVVWLATRRHLPC